MTPMDYVLVACGILYIVKPNIFRRGIWTKTSVMQRTMSPQSYVLTMRLMGVMLVALGVYRLFVGR